MIILEARGAFDIEVTTAAERAVRADNDRLGATWELSGRELLLVVFLERGSELGNKTRVGDGQSLDV